MSSYEGGPDHLQSNPPGPQWRPEEPKSGSNGRTIALVGGIGAAGLLIAGGAMAATMFFSAGAQPAEALPDNTVAYVSVDLNPSGGQKIEAFRMLRKFPAIADEFELKDDTDLLEELFDQATAEGNCTGVSYADDVKPWLGSRAAVAAVKGSAEVPDPVVVLQVKDEKSARAGLDKLESACGGDGAESGAGIAVQGEWAVFAETQEIADAVVSGAEDKPLADDATFKKWIDEAGGDAIVSAYVSPLVADYAEQIARASSEQMGSDDPFADMEGFEDLEGLEGFDELSEPAEPDPATVAEVKEALEKFEGAAAAIRFEDAGVSVEFAAGVDQDVKFLSDAAGDLVGDLPAETVAALGIGLEDGWLDRIDEQLVEAGVDTSVSDLLTEVGVDKTELEAALGDGLAVAVGPGIDPDAISNGGPEEIPVALVFASEAEDLSAVVHKVAETSGEDVFGEAPWLEPVAGDGVAVVSPHESFRDSIVSGDSSLADSDTYRSVTDGVGDAQSLLFVDFDADDNWLVRVAGTDSQEIADNLEPLKAFGVVSWFDADVAHVKLKLTTD